MQNHRAFLQKILVVGGNLIDLIQLEVQARADAISRERSTSAEPATDLAIAFDRITRAMRRTIALDLRLAEPVQAKPARSPAQQRTDARKSIIREVEDAIRDTAEEADGKALRDEFYLRLDTPDLEDDIRHRPVADIISQICTDLGLDDADGLNAPRRRTPEDLARLCARAAAPPAPSDPPPKCDPPDRRARH